MSATGVMADDSSSNKGVNTAEISGGVMSRKEASSLGELGLGIMEK